MNIIDELSWRGAVNQMTDEEGLRKLTEEKSISLYCGVDPTGDSMHIGHLIPFMMLKRFANAGHHPFVVIGGGTGTIGDPSGRKTERQLQTLDTIKNNAEKLKAQFTHLFGDSENITFVNNYDWLSQIGLLEFLRDYGKLFSVNIMVSTSISDLLTARSALWKRLLKSTWSKIESRSVLVTVMNLYIHTIPLKLLINGLSSVWAMMLFGTVFARPLDMKIG